MFYYSLVELSTFQFFEDPCLIVEEVKILKDPLDEEQSLEPKIKEFLPCLVPLNTRGKQTPYFKNMQDVT